MWHVGVAGDPVAHSLSPALQHLALDHLGLDGEAIRLHTTSLDDLSSFLAGTGQRALSITTPLKEAVVSLCDDIDGPSRVAGAVNSVLHHGGKVFGRNVDGEGLVQAVEAVTGRKAAGAQVLVLGGGGAARSCVAALLAHGAEVTVATRRSLEVSEWNRGARLTTEMSVGVSTDWVINATSSTLKGEGIDLVALDPQNALAIDLSYGHTSLFLEECAKKGWSTLDGLPMLYFQAKLQLEWWFDQEIDIEVLGWQP